MKFGLTNEQMEQICNKLLKSGVSKAVIFGSRAKGTHRCNSDIDIAVWGDGLYIERIFSELDELPMPYKFDVVEYDKITHIALREHIDRVGISFLK